MAVVKFSKQTIEPNPLEVDYWVDITSDPYGSVWKYYNGIDWVSLNLNDGSDDGLSSFDYYTKEQVNALLSGKADADSVESKVDDAEFANVIQNIEFREIGDNQMEMVLLKYDNATVGVTIPMASETNPGMLSGESFRDFVKQSQLQSLYDELYQIMSDLSLAEKERNDAEQLRNTRENERITAETNRFNAENTRQSEEANRVTNESNRITAENNRTTAEGNRESTFNTLKGQMQTTIQEGQTAVAATEKATSDAQKVVDEYDTKVAEQDTKLSELGSKVDGLEGSLNGVVDLDISDTLLWTHGLWHFSTNQGVGNDYQKGMYRYSNKIDISNYDEVKLSGLWNGNDTSSTNNIFSTITFFGDGEQIGWKNYQYGEPFVVFRYDYKDYEKLEIVLNAYQSEETYVPSVKVTKERGLSKDVKDLKKESASVEETVSKLETSILGVDNVDIADTLTWTNGVWHYQNNTGGGNDYQKQTYRYSNKIDISDYDGVKLSGIWNGTSASASGNTMASITFFGDNEPIKFIQVVDGESYVIFRSDYRQYDKLEIVLNARQSEETYVPSVIVNKNSVFEGEFIPKRIVLCGDSLMGNESSLITLQLNSIAKAQGYEIVRHTMGGENIIGNLTRNGGIGIRVTADFVMPIRGSVDIEVESAWMKSDGTYAQNPYNNATNRDVRIMGIKGKLTRNSTTSYTFTRNDEGESFKVSIGTLLWDEALWSCKDYPHIWFTGQNMGYENEQDWADMINMAARNFGENFVVCSTALAGTTNQLVRCATKTFGDKYINLKAYTEGQAVYDGQRFGLIDSSASADDYGSLFWPGTDKVHQNNLLSYMWAVLMWNTLLDLGYVEGARIETGEYYKQ